jgi:hypothetical protein
VVKYQRGAAYNTKFLDLKTGGLYRQHSALKSVFTAASDTNILSMQPEELAVTLHLIVQGFWNFM